MAYADTSELQQRWRTLTDAEQVTAALYLEDVSREADRRFPALAGRAADPNVAADVAMVVCEAVRRRMTYEEEQPEGGSPNPSLATFTANELAVLRGPVDYSASGLALWSNDLEVPSGAGRLPGPAAVYGA